MSLHIDSIELHRNGICGGPFHVVLFVDGNGPMVGLVFDRPGHVAVLHRDRLAAGDIAFGSNSWRGDRYEAELRAAITKWERRGQ
jgi:hypothetical protein